VGVSMVMELSSMYLKSPVSRKEREERTEFRLSSPPAEL
jgi:hypothetical protein